MRIQDKIELSGATVESGLLGGALGGTILLVLAMVPSPALSQSLGASLRAAATPLLGSRASGLGVDAPVVGGVVAHLIVSLAWGLAFAAVSSRWTLSTTLLAGIPFGAVVWLLMTFVLLPLAGIRYANLPAEATGYALVIHACFGIACAVGILCARR